MCKRVVCEPRFGMLAAKSDDKHPGTRRTTSTPERVGLAPAGVLHAFGLDLLLADLF